MLRGELTGATCALIGVIPGPLFGMVAGVFIAFLMRSSTWTWRKARCCTPRRPVWAHDLPGYGASRIDNPELAVMCRSAAAPSSSAGSAYSAIGAKRTALAPVIVRSP